MANSLDKAPLVGTGDADPTGGPMLCEVVSLTRGRDISLDKDLRGQRAAALQARSVEQCQSLTWLSSQPEPIPDQHGTDPNTGECTQQYSTAMQTKMKRYIFKRQPVSEECPQPKISKYKHLYMLACRGQGQKK